MPRQLEGWSCLIRNLQQASRTELICRRLEAGSSTCNSGARCLYPLHSPVSPSLPLPCVTVCHQVPNELYHKQHALPAAVLERKTKNDRNLATIFVINEKLKNLKLQTRSDSLVARYYFLLSVSSLPERGFFRPHFFCSITGRRLVWHCK